MMAFVQYNNPDGSAEFCSGTVLSSDVVLTAGHCGEDITTGVLDVSSQYEVATGNVDWADSTSRQVSGVSEVIVSPGFDPQTLDGDAALLVLSTPTTAPPVQLASDPADLGLLNAGTGETIAGWGQTATSGGVVEQLQWANTVVQTPAYCAARASQIGATFDSGDQLCVIDAPTCANGQCHGDSGGPLLANYGGMTTEVGIISFGAADCSTAQAGFLTRADAISSWASGWIQAVRPVRTPPAPPAPPTPSPSPAPVPAPAPPAGIPASTPQAGGYRGQTSQRWPINLRVAASARALRQVKFSLRLRCTRRKLPAFTFAPSMGRTGWPLNQAAGMSFSRSFQDSTGEHYRLAGTFTADGSAMGTLTSSWRIRRYGTCTTGLIRWHAER
jgi:trypsin